MLINQDNGVVIINAKLKVEPHFNFDDFKNTPFFHGQDAIRIIRLADKQEIDGNEYLVSLFFRNNEIYSVSLILNDKSITEKNEKMRKSIHDKILRGNGLQSNNIFYWGKVISEYDARSNISEITIYYK